MKTLKKIILAITLSLLAFVMMLSCKDKFADLSFEQKINEFEYLYEVLEENCPYLDVAGTEFNIHWLEKKKEYLNRIKNAPTDSAYLSVLSSILNETGSGHIGMAPMFSWKDYYEIYKKGALEKPVYKTWVDVLKSVQPQSEYWQEVSKKVFPYYYDYVSESAEVEFESVTTKIIIEKENKIAVIRIKSFWRSYLEKDSVLVNDFIEKIADCNHLIIDIQDNGGGAVKLWKEHIVGRLIEEDITVSYYDAIKKGEHNELFYPDILAKQGMPKENFPNLPPEFLSDNVLIDEIKDTVVSINPVPFEGQVYLLINENIYSQSERFTNFCNLSDWAITAGCEVVRDGTSSSEPILLKLPESGILITYPSTVSLNPDGSYASKIISQLSVEGTHPDERLDNLIEYIKTNP